MDQSPNADPGTNDYPAERLALAGRLVRTKGERRSLWGLETARDAQKDWQNTVGRPKKSDPAAAGILQQVLTPTRARDVLDEYRVGYRLSGLSYIDARSIPEPNSGCWLWLGPVNSKGYGTIDKDGFWLAHRYAYWAAKGGIPDGLGVCHKCDNPYCVNPDHLFAGDQKQNIDDARRKGRPIYEFPKGAASKRSKLTEDQVREIRRAAVKGDPILGYKALGKRMGVAGQTVKMAATGMFWRGLQ